MVFVFSDLSNVSSNVKIRHNNIDKTALSQLPGSAPRGYLPNITIGDGNCVARSLATLVFGDENKYHLEMRLRLIHELVSNKPLYLDSAFLNKGCTQEPKDIVFEMLFLCDDVKDLNDKHASYEDFVWRTRLLKKELSNWHLHAAAQLLGVPIISVHPDLGIPRNVNLMRRGFFPSSTDYSLDLEKVLYVMWTSARTDMRDEHWIPNHTVPLLKN